MSIETLRCVMGDECAAVLDVEGEVKRWLGRGWEGREMETEREM